MMSLKDKLMEALHYSVKTKFFLVVQGGHILPGYISYTLIFANQAIDIIENKVEKELEKELEFDTSTINTVQTMLCK